VVLRTTELKRDAVAFLQAAANGGDPVAAARRVFVPTALHHNPFFPAGIEALAKAIAKDHKKHPKTTIEVKHVIAEGDLVAVHSHVRWQKRDPGFAVVHLFRFHKGKAVELWDVGQKLPPKSRNRDGAF
jgi:predicted SnoaL-like aldol condensation-catalyzing enzyme